MSVGWLRWNEACELQCANILADVERIAAKVPKGPTPTTFIPIRDIPSYSETCHSRFEKELWKRGVSIRYYSNMIFEEYGCAHVQGLEVYHHRSNWNLYQKYKDHWTWLTTKPLS